MSTWSTIIADDTTRATVQEGMLTRAIHDPLYPRLLFRSEAEYDLWEANIGDSMVFTGSGLLPKRGRSRQPGIDPTPDNYGFEQWNAQLRRLDGTLDVHHPSTIRQIVNMALQRASILGASAGRTMDSAVRNRLYAAALSGNTYATKAEVAPATSLLVQCCFGFHEMRQSGKVRYAAPSVSNPIPILVGTTAVNVIGCSPNDSSPEGIYGPGVLTLAAPGTTWILNAPVRALDASLVYRAGGGTTMHALTAADKLTLALIRSAVAEMRDNNVPTHEDGYYHVHLDATSEAELFEDTEWKNIHTAAYDSMAYREAIIGVKMGCVFYRNTEAPNASTVQDLTGTGWDADDAFPGGKTVTANATSVQVRRTLVTGREAIYEKFSDPDLLISDAGVTGKTGWFDINMNGISVITDRVKFIWRAPLNRTMDESSMTWLFDGDWAVRTDSLIGNLARYKRCRCIEHA